MKRPIIYIPCIVAMSLLAGCQSNEPDSPAQGVSAGDIVEFGLGDVTHDSRTHYDDDLNGRTQLDWSMGDNLLLRYYESDTGTDLQGHYRVSAVNLGDGHKFHAALSAVTDDSHKSLIWAAGSQHFFQGLYPYGKGRITGSYNDPYFEFDYSMNQDAVLQSSGVSDNTLVSTPDMENCYMVAARNLGGLDLKNNKKVMLEGDQHIVLRFQSVMTTFDLSIASELSEQVEITKVVLRVPLKLNGSSFKVKVGTDNWWRLQTPNDFIYTESHNNGDYTDFNINTRTENGPNHIALAPGKTLKVMGFIPCFKDENELRNNGGMKIIIYTNTHTFTIPFTQARRLAKNNIAIKLKDK